MIETDDIVGTPFVAGGREPGRGLDCFGVLLLVHARLGLPLDDIQATPETFEGTDVGGMLDAFAADWEPCTRPFLPGDVLLMERAGNWHCLPVVDAQGVYGLHVERDHDVRLVRVSRVARVVVAAMRRKGLPS